MYRPLLTVGMFAVALAVPVLLTAQDRKPEHPPEHMMSDHDKCAAVCGECQRVCDMCAAHCAKMVAEGKKEHLTSLQTCLDCADFCAAAAQIVARRGPFSDTICQACAEACARCAKECEKHPNDAHMKHCAEVCRKCEKACRDMLAHLGHQKSPPPK